MRRVIVLHPPCPSSFRFGALRGDIGSCRSGLAGSVKRSNLGDTVLLDGKAVFSRNHVLPRRVGTGFIAVTSSGVTLCAKISETLSSAREASALRPYLKGLRSYSFDYLPNERGAILWSDGQHWRNPRLARLGNLRSLVAVCVVTYRDAMDASHTWLGTTNASGEDR